MTLTTINSRLKKIEKQYKEYFIVCNKGIFDCVHVITKRPFSVHLKDNNLPEEVKDQIESLLWVE